MERVVFLDRDGALNEEVCYLYRPEDLHILPGVGEALRMLKEAGYRLVVVTNQAGVARGYYTEEDVRRLHLHMNRLLALMHFITAPITRSMALDRIRYSANAGNLEPGCLRWPKGGLTWTRPIPSWWAISYWTWRRGRITGLLLFWWEPDTAGNSMKRI